MRGQLYRDFERPSADKGESLAWLCSSGMKGGTESLTTARQDQALNTLYHHRNIMEQPSDSTRGADKSLARTTSRCLRTKSIVSLEIGVCSCVELQVFSCCHQPPPPARQGAEGNSRNSERNIRSFPSCMIVINTFTFVTESHVR